MSQRHFVSFALAFGVGVSHVPVKQLLAQVNTDSIRRAEQARVEQYRSQVASAAAVFLDTSRPEGERLGAVRNVVALLEPQQRQRSLGLATSSAESVPIRVRALQLTGGRVTLDSVVRPDVARLVIDSGTPRAVRTEAIRQIAANEFTLRDRDTDAVRALRVGMRDSDSTIRRLSLQVLAGRADPIALRELQSGLQDSRRALVPPSVAVRLLGQRDPSPYYPLLHRLLQQPPDTDTRIAAIELLGGYSPSRPLLIGILRNASEWLPAREAAFGALAANALPDVSSAVVPVLRDESGPAQLRVRAITFFELKRTSRDPRIVNRSPDEIDRTIRQLASSSPNDQVRAAASRYVARTSTAR